MKFTADENYDALNRFEKWDPETQTTIKERVANELGDVLSYEFLTEREGEILELLLDALIPQEKNSKYIIKISEIIDRDLAKDTKGVRYGANPWPREFYQTGIADFASHAKEIFGKPIEDFSMVQIEKYIAEIFERNADDFLYRFARKVLSDATAIYFSHPASWNMIGFPGPAYPLGYPFLDCSEKEDWEPSYRKR